MVVPPCPKPLWIKAQRGAGGVIVATVASSASGIAAARGMAWALVPPCAAAMAEHARPAEQKQPVQDLLRPAARRYVLRKAHLRPNPLLSPVGRIGCGHGNAAPRA